MSQDISDTANRVRYTATAGQTVFAIPFEFAANAHLEVYRNSTKLTLTTQYTLSGAGATGGGTMTLVTAAALNDDILIVRDIPKERQGDFPVSGIFDVESLNSQLDNHIMMMKDTDTRLDRRVLGLSVTDSPEDLNDLPTRTNRANKILGFDADGQPAVQDANAHTHAISAVSGLQAALDGKAASLHTHLIADVSGLQSALNGKAATSHNHSISDVTGLQAALDSKLSSAHTHVISDVTGLQTALDGKAATSHTHTIANVTGLQTALDNKLDDSQASAFGLSLLDDADAAAARTTLGLGTAALSASGDFAAASHTHTIANVTGLQTALDNKLDDSQATAFGLSLLDDADAAAARTTLGLGTAATSASSAFASSSHNHTLDSLSNVSITSLSVDQYLKWNGTAWVNSTVSGGGGGGGASDLDGLTDVAIISPATGHVLRHDGTQFVNVLGTTHFAAASHTHTASDISNFAEAVDDEVASLLVAGSNVSLTYNDTANTLTIDAGGNFVPLGPATQTSLVPTPLLNLNQTFNASTIAATGASGTGSIATVTFATQASAIPVGSTIVVSGFTPTTYNGTYVVTASTTSSVSYSNASVSVPTVIGTIQTRSTGILFNVTDTASAASSLLMDMQVGGASRFNVAKTGALGITSTADVTHTLAGPSFTATLSAPGLALAAPASGIRFNNNANFNATNLTLSFNNDVTLSRRAAANLRLGAADAAAPVAQTLSVQSVSTGTANTAGQNLTITGSQGTGSAAGGAVRVLTAAAGSASTFPVTFTGGSATISGTGLPTVAGTPVAFTTTGALPTGFNSTTTYYVLSGATSTAITVSATPGGTAITAPGVGSGTHTLTQANAQNNLVERIQVAPSGAIGLSGANFGTTGQVITSQGSNAAPIWSNGGAWERVAVTTISSAVAQVDFTNLGAYAALRITINNLRVSTGADLSMRLSSDNGATFIATNSYVTSRNAATSQFGLTDGPGSIGNATGDGGFSNVLFLNNFNIAQKTMGSQLANFGDSGGAHATANDNFFHSGQTVMNAFRLFATTGNITAGTILVEGWTGS